MNKALVQRIFSLTPGDDIWPVAREVFAFQYTHNAVYRKFCMALGRSPGSVASLRDIPFLPIEVFKSKRVTAFQEQETHVFTSSGTTQSGSSRHFVYDLSVYHRSFLSGFHQFYGDPADWCILALLPAYLERQGSSLVYMARHLMEASGHPLGGFYLDDFGKLASQLRTLVSGGQKVLLLGVSFAMLDLAEAFPMDLRQTVVMETGGMKGRRKEMLRKELHEILKSAFQTQSIHSEYGMTELFSQAYSGGEGVFRCPPWMRVLIRDGRDPLSWTDTGRMGGINVVDLANVYSCSFIATQDLGRMNDAGDFWVEGRFDHSDVRGCNLMVAEG